MSHTKHKLQIKCKTNDILHIYIVYDHQYLLQKFLSFFTKRKEKKRKEKKRKEMKVLQNKENEALSGAERYKSFIHMMCWPPLILFIIIIKE
jgi:hypothetical protein